MTTATPAELLIDLSSAAVGARALQVVTEAGIPDLISAEPRTADEIAADAQVNADALARLLRLLEPHGVFQRDAQGNWEHTEPSRWLRTDHPQSLSGYVRMSGTAFSWGSLTHLDHALRSGEAGICQLEPLGWCAYLESRPEEKAVFQAAMTAKSHGDITAALDVYDFGQHHRIADIAGGQGLLIKTILAAYPNITGVLFELPSVASNIAVSDRLEVVKGNFFTDPLPACDAYVLMNIIHDWDDEAATQILRAVANAAHEYRSTVLLLEAVLPEAPIHHRAKILDVMMLAITGGRERTVAEYRALLHDAGLELKKVIPTRTAFSIIEAELL